MPKLPEVNFTPFSDIVLIQEKPRNMTDGGIALPDDADPEPTRGLVVKCGPGRVTEDGTLLPMSVAPGDYVLMLFAYQQALKVTLGGKQYLITRNRDCIAKIEKDWKDADDVAAEVPVRNKAA